MARHWISLSCLFFSLSLSAQIDGKSYGAVSAGLGNIKAVSEGAESVYGNISGITSVDGFHAIFTSYAPFGLFQLTAASAGIVLPVKTGKGLFSATRFGNSLYSENTVSAGFAHKIDFVSLGATASLFRVSIAEYGNSTTALFNFGGTAHLTEQVKFGALIQNFSISRMSRNTPEPLPVIMYTGIQYEPIQAKIRITVEAEKEINFSPSLKTGISYQVSQALTLRSGISTNPSRIHLGTGFSSGKLQVNYGGFSHPYLKFSHAISIIYLII